MKKTIKKLVSLLLVTALLTLSVGMAVSAKTTDILKYDKNGTFKILHITDTHQGTDGVKTSTFIGEAIDYAQPDLVVFGGDNQTAGANREDAFAAIKSLIDPIVERGVPFALVFGNHDREGGITNEEQMAEFQTYAGCLAIDGEDVYGCGNYNLPIYDSEGKNIINNLWFFDSGSSNPDTEVGGYDYVRKDQIDWYIKASEKLEAQCGRKVPSIAFQHIIVPEIYELFPETFIPIKEMTYNGVSRLPIPDFTKFSGYMQELPCPPYVSEGEFDAWVERGDIMAAVFGHDHINCFVANIDGIDLVQSPGSGFEGGYGSNLFRGARLITLSEDEPDSYETELVTYKDLAKLDGSELGKVIKSNAIFNDVVLIPLEFLFRTICKMLGFAIAK